MGKCSSTLLFVVCVTHAAAQDPPAGIGVVVQRGAMGALISDVIAGSPMRESGCRCYRGDRPLFFPSVLRR